ncbi:MAG: hypothetical protein WC114_09580 [Smithellaceae bacterium]
MDMNRFYQGDKLADLERVLASWLGTPHRHGCGVKSGGVDCTLFICRVLEETGFADKPYKLPAYSADWFRHSGEERLLDWMIGNVPHERIDKPEDGAIVLFTFGRMISHSAFYYQDHLYHSLNKRGVIRSAFKGCPWSRKDRVAYILRPVRAS